ncbi:hypothetical protein [Arenibaculum pallidiluteum]|uniref:hypothetical protein n=1 Tax=Arenibaculum pallidiluteum TaxID=2812559 RepID=UPI001A96F2DD|nr:hypothetical protein [Arenibaculum pallidiluteum]
MARSDPPREANPGPEKVGVYPAQPAAPPGSGASVSGMAASTTSTGPATQTETMRTVDTGRTDGSYYAAQASPMRWAVPVLAVIVIVLALIWLL